MKTTVISNRYRVEFRHAKGMHTTWSTLPENEEITLPRARAVVRESRRYEDDKRGGFQQRIIRTRIQETVVT